jgi:hypothetical protein
VTAALLSLPPRARADSKLSSTRGHRWRAPSGRWSPATSW